MFTECPACQTIFRVTGAILRAGHGQVECGKCHTIFDAIERLIDDIPPGPAPSASLEPAAAPASLPDGNGSGTSPASVRWANDLPTGEFFLQGGELIPIADRLPAEGAEASTQQIDVDEPGAPEEITLEGDSIQISGVYRAPAEWPEVEEEEEETEALLPPLDETAAGIAVVENDPPPVSDDLESELAAAETGTHRAVAWTVFSLLLLVGLLVQGVHHYRQELARHPRVGPQLVRLYAALHLPLAPNWDVTGYEIQQWGVAADPAANGTLRLRASIMNRAGFAQPYPLVKLTLEDRWGEQVGAREFEAAEYLGPGTPADRMLAPNQRVNADIGIVDPGEDAVGFHVDICLRTFDGLDCASQTAKAQ